MRRPDRLMSLAALTCAGLLATAPAYADCGCDAPSTTARPAAVIDADANVDLGLGLDLGVAVDLGLDLGVGADVGADVGTGTATTGCGAPQVVRTCG